MSDVQHHIYKPMVFVVDEFEGAWPAVLNKVEAAFQVLGYEATQHAADAQVIWTNDYPFVFDDERSSPRMAAAQAVLRSMPQKFVNQIPGLGWLTTKPALAALSHTLPFLPKSFVLPEAKQEFQDFIESGGGAGMEWVQKNPTHRGIHIVTDPAAFAAAEQPTEVLVQQLVRPQLLDGRLWDFGVYVAITSVAPLTAYIYTGGVLVRFCSMPYVRDITADTDIGHYVISGPGSWIHGIKIPGMERHYADAGADTEMGNTMGLAALRSALSAQGVNTTKWWLDVQSVVVQMLQTTVPLMVEEQQLLFPGQLRASFFTLMRFDFLLDEAGRTFLVEVNMSPDLWGGENRTRQDSALLHKLPLDVLTLKGLAPGGRWHDGNPQLAELRFHPDAVAVGEPSCAEQCGNDSGDVAAGCSAKLECLLCRECRSPWQNELLLTVMAEQLHAQAWRRVHPPGRELEAHMVAAAEGAEGAAAPPAAYFDVSQRVDDVLVKLWLDRKCANDHMFC